MSWMPGVTHRPLGKQTQPKMKRYDVLCLHTMVGSLWGTDSMFQADGYGGTESHFGVGPDGETVQWQDTAYTADANLDGNGRVLSVETADKGEGFPAWSGSDVPFWTEAQLDALARICVWAHLEHGIPLVLCPDSKPGSRGIGYHRQGCDGNYPNGRVAGGEKWSSSRGKVCPGDRRIAQVPEVLRRARILAGQSGNVSNPVPSLPKPAPAPAPGPSTGKKYGAWYKGAAGTRTVGLWDAGDDVKVVQRAVGAVVDGYFGPGGAAEGGTLELVKLWQQRNQPQAGAVDGMIGSKGWTIILSRPAPAPAPAPAPRPAPAPAPKPVSPRNAAETVATQKAVRAAADGFWGDATDRHVNLVRAAALAGTFPEGVKPTQLVVGTAADGAWGPNSKRALTRTVKALQAAWGVPADGQWGPQTDRAWAAARGRNWKTW